MAMFKLSEILERGMKGITSYKIKLVRHKASSVQIDGKPVKDSTPYTLYVDHPDLFLQYQSEQKEDVFRKVDYIVSFIGEEGTTARLIGVFKVEGYDEERRSKCDPNRFYYKLSEVDAFKDGFNERVIIDWGPGTRRFDQWLDPGKKDKDVLSIERQGVEWHFPGYEKVVLSFNRLKRIIDNNAGVWKDKLTAVKGIYVISDKSTGKLYVGAAFKEKEGIWGRWEVYAHTGGHGNNVILQAILKKDPTYAVRNFQWGILQTCSQFGHVD